MRGAPRCHRRTAARAALVALIGIVLLVVLWQRGAGDVPSAAGASVAAPSAPASSAASVGAAPALAEPERAQIAEPERAQIAEPEPSAEDPPWPTVRGRLIDPASHGVGGMVVVYEGRPGTPPSKMWRRALDTEDDGAFAIDLHVASSYVLVGMAYGFAPSAPLSFEVLDARRPPDITLAVQALAEIRGVVVDDAGAPRSGGRIDAMLPFDQSGAAPPWSQEGERNPTAVVEQDGSFVLAGALPDRTYTLIYEPGDGRSTRASWRGIRPNDGPLVLTARDDDLRCGFVGGSVRDAGGAPLTRYQITIGRSTGRVDATTGRFEMQVKWGTEAPVLVQVGARPVVFEVGACRIDREAQELTLQLPPPGALTVHVRDGAGAHVAGVSVAAELDVHARCGAESWSCAVLLQPRKTLPGGTARFATLGPGRYRVIAKSDGAQADTTATVQPGVESSVEITLPVR
jgi:hypothetical protein